MGVLVTPRPYGQWSSRPTTLLESARIVARSRAMPQKVRTRRGSSAARPTSRRGVAHSAGTEVQVPARSEGRHRENGRSDGDSNCDRHVLGLFLFRVHRQLTPEPEVSSERFVSTDHIAIS